MSLTKLALTNFRCFEALSLKLPRQLVLTGANGRGKSSVLEAITLLALTRSTRAAHEAELVRTGETTATVEGTLGPRQIIRVVLERQGSRLMKRANRFGRAVALSQLVGSVHAVLFAPEDMELFTGPPRLRRRLLDGLLLQRDGSGYAHQLVTLYRTLKQRNAVLAHHPSLEALRSQIAVWDLLLAEVARTIIEKRTTLTRELTIHTSQALERMQVPLTVTLTYRPTVTDLDRLSELLVARLERDREVGATTVGPHRDDLEAVANGRPLAAASRGEQRAVLVALKLAEYELLHAATGEEPLFLIDDVFSEFDPTRRAHITSAITERPCIVTSADPASLPSQLSNVPRYEL